MLIALAGGIDSLCYYSATPVGRAIPRTVPKLARPTVIGRGFFLGAGCHAVMLVSAGPLQKSSIHNLFRHAGLVPASTVRPING
jgi:hypothetical protein